MKFHLRLDILLLALSGAMLCESTPLQAERWSPSAESTAVEIQAPTQQSRDVALLTPREVAIYPRDGGNIAIAVAYGGLATKLTDAVCTAGPALGPIGAGGCVATAILSVVTTFFLFFKALSGREPNPSGLFLSDYSPTEDCSVACMLDATAPEGDWQPFGNFTTDLLFHELHFSKKGSILGIRSYQQPVSSIVSRSDEGNDGGIVVDYMWEGGNQAAYNSFGSSNNEEVTDSNFFEQKLEQSDSVVECAGWRDNNGLLAAGLLAVGWDNRAYNWQPGESQVYLDRCAKQM
jgi:hypothetical protein